jgi:ClpA/ClpB-like protein
MFELFTDSARQAVVLGQEESRKLKHQHIGTEHLLLGVLRLDGERAVDVLESHGVTYTLARGAVARIVGEGAAETHGQIPFTARAKAAIERAASESRYGDGSITPGHLLLGVLNDRESVAVRAAQDLDADVEAIETDVVDMLTIESGAAGIELEGAYVDAGQWEAYAPEEEAAAGAIRAFAGRRRELAASMLEREYEFVSGMIPFYRRVELTALGGAGLVVSSVLAAVAALAGKGSHEAVEGGLLAGAAWGPAILLLVEAMALTRMRRASLYLRNSLRPLVVELTGEPRLLQWELAPSAALREAGHGRVAGMMVSSAGIVLAMALSTLAMSAIGIAIHPTAATLALGLSATAFALAITAYGLSITLTEEGRA